MQNFYAKFLTKQSNNGHSLITWGIVLSSRVTFSLLNFHIWSVAAIHKFITSVRNARAFSPFPITALYRADIVSRKKATRGNASPENLTFKLFYLREFVNYILH